MYSSLIDTPEPVRRLVGVASRTRTYSLLQRLIRGAGSPPVRNGQVLAADVDVILDRSIGSDAYHRDDRWRQQVPIHFRSSLGRIVDLASDAGASVMLVIPACNLRDGAPLKSEHRDDLTSAELREFLASFHAGEKALEAGDSRAALSRIDRAIQIDSRHAAAHFLRGRALLKAGDAAAAHFHPNNSNLHYAIARQAAQQGNYAAAKEELEIVLTLEPDHVDARRLRANIGR